MKTNTIFACGLLVVLSVTGWFLTHREQVTPAPSVPPARDAAKTLPVAARQVALTPPPGGVTSPAPPAPPVLPQGEAALEAIQTLATTYDAKEVPALARYLESSSREVRAAALQGLIQLGDGAAVPYLKAAADKTMDTQEQSDLLKAAEFLALPSWREHRPTLNTGAATQK